MPGAMPPSQGQGIATRLCPPAIASLVASTPFIVAVWFALNISIAIVTRKVYDDGIICMGDECWRYRYPYWLTVVHMLCSWGFCAFYQKIAPSSRVSEVTFTFREQLVEIVPLAACFAFATVFNNVSLLYIFPSLNQMLGSATLVFTVLLVPLVLQAYHNMWTWAALLMICGGMSICTEFEGNFNFFGVTCCLLGCGLRALRSVLAERMLTRGMRPVDSVTLLRYMAPWSALMLLFAAIMSEGVSPMFLPVSGPIFNHWRFLNSVRAPRSTLPIADMGRTIALLLLSGANACLLNVCNFVVTKATSAATLQLLGQLKNCMAILVSVAIFGNLLTVKQLVGMSIVFAGVWLYHTKGERTTAPWLLPDPEKGAVEKGKADPAETDPFAKAAKLSGSGM